MDAFITGATVAAVIGLLAITRISPDIVLMAGLTILLLLQVVTPEQALIGFANPGLVTVGALYVVAAAMRQTGAVSWIALGLLGQPRSLVPALLRLTLPVGLLSAFVNNTPVVSIMVPVVRDWARRTGLSASHLLMPLSFAAIVGGTCTIIGTTTNLVVNGMLIDATGDGLGFFELALVGLPVSAAALVYMILLSGRLLPDARSDALSSDDLKRYTVEMLVESRSSLVGKTIEEAGLRHLPGLYLLEIERGAVSLPVVAPDTVLCEDDRLIFAGLVESVVDLQRFDGLRLASDQVFKLNTKRANHTLLEVVVADACPLVGKTIREGRFRNVYNAAVIAVSRNGEHLHAKIGDIVLRPGDMLLLEAHVDFQDQNRNSKDFLLVSRVEDSQPLKSDKRGIASLVFVGMVLMASLEVVSLLEAAMLAAGLMILFGCTSASGARREVSWQVLIVIGASIGLGNAIAESGIADAISALMLASAGVNALIVLSLVFVVTALMSAFITNIAAATMMFPIVLKLGEASGMDLTAMVVTLMVAASASFATPIGYQTNLMVQGPGGYSFVDFLRFGGPLTLVVGVVTVAVAGLMIA